MKIFSQYQTDEDAEVDGVWVDLGDGGRVKVARFGNPVHEKVMERLRRPYRNMLRSGRDLPKDIQDRLTIEGLAESILLDWSGLEDENGKAIAFSKKKAKELLTDLKDFRNAVSFLALEAETFRKEALEEAAKNSVKPSKPA